MTLPSFKSLLALEAVVRLGTTVRAAEALSISQTAVSHRLKGLEAVLGVPLFTRSGGSLRPTPQAIALAGTVRICTGLLEQSLAEMGGDHAQGRRLAISMLPALASKWLAPHLAAMSDALEGTEIYVNASRTLVDLRGSEVEAAIRYGRGEWPEITAFHLGNEFLSPVLSRELYERERPQTPSDLLQLPLLDSDIPDGWADWFASAGLSAIRPRPAAFFNDDAALIEACIAGHGVCLGRSVLVANDLRGGRLVAPFGLCIPATYGYWLVRHQATAESRAFHCFLHWARSTLRKDAEIFRSPG